MKKNILLLLISFVGYTQSDNEDFVIEYFGKNVENSYYSKIESIDSRENKKDCGFVVKGLLNDIYDIVPTAPLTDQFEYNLNMVNTSPKENGTLLIQLKDLKFSCFIESFGAIGYFHFSANAYEKIDSVYYLINKIDYLDVNTSPGSAKNTKKEAQKVISDFLETLLNQKSNRDEKYTYSQIEKIRQFEKSTIPLYFNKEIKTGFYRNYTDLKNATPIHEEISITKNKKGVIQTAFYKSSDGTQNPIYPSNTFAYSVDGETYISFKGKFHKLIKESDEFYIKIYINENTGYNQMGLTGALIGTAMNQHAGEKKFKLHYATGNFMLE